MKLWLMALHFLQQAMGAMLVAVSRAGQDEIESLFAVAEGSQLIDMETGGYL